jgi:hypothetical protein
VANAFSGSVAKLSFTVILLRLFLLKPPRRPQISYAERAEDILRQARDKRLTCGRIGEVAYA